MKRYSTHPAVYAGLMSVVFVSVPSTALALSAQTLSSLPGPRVVIPVAVAACVSIAGITYGIARKQALKQLENSYQTEQDILQRMDSVIAESDASSDTDTTGAHAARDYEQIAQNYVNRQRYQERVAIQQRGVMATLLERLGARFSGSMMDGLPVIERADGSVGDVGTSWWEATVGPNITRGSIFEPVPDDPTAPQLQTPTPQAAQSRRRHAEVVSRVAHLDLGMYPKRRESQELSDKRDMWELALAALDEKLDDTGSVAINIPSSAPKPVMARVAAELTGQMVVDDKTTSSAPAAQQISAQSEPFSTSGAQGMDLHGMDVLGIDTLDEPDFPEPSTEVLHFHVPANHPEITDEKSYVAYLISDEEAKVQSKRYGAHAKKYDYLRVIDGGTNTRLQVLQPSKKSSYQPRHMKQVSEAASHAVGTADSFVIAQQG